MSTLVEAVEGHLTYSGDVRHIVGEVHGPTTYGVLMTAVTADYDPAGDRTSVGFRPARTGDFAAP